MDHYCRICSDEITENEYERLNSCNLPLLMQLYLPELVTEVADSRVCLKCFSVLQLFHTLRKKALQTETCVQKYADANSNRTSFTLTDVLGKKVVADEQKGADVISIEDSNSEPEEEEVKPLNETSVDEIVKEELEMELDVKDEIDSFSGTDYGSSNDGSSDEEPKDQKKVDLLIEPDDAKSEEFRMKLKRRLSSFLNQALKK